MSFPFNMFYRLCIINIPERTWFINTHHISALRRTTFQAVCCVLLWMMHCKRCRYYDTTMSMLSVIVLRNLCRNEITKSWKSRRWHAVISLVGRYQDEQIISCFMTNQQWLIRYFSDLVIRWSTNILTDQKDWMSWKIHCPFIWNHR